MKLPEVEGWKLEGNVYKKGGKAAIYSEKTNVLTVGFYIPVGTKITEEVVNSEEDVKELLSKY